MLPVLRSGCPRRFSEKKRFVPRLLDPGKDFLRSGRRGSSSTCETYLWCVGCVWQRGWVQAGLSEHCLDVASRTTLSFSSALCPCSSAHVPGSSQRSLAEQHGSASSLSGIHSGFDSAPASLSTSGRDGMDTLPDALCSGSSKQDH